MANSERRIVVDYCKEAMEMQLSKLSTRDIDLIVINLAKVINGELKDLEIDISKTGEKTISVPAVSFLRTDNIKNSLKTLGITEIQINAYLNKSNKESKVKKTDTVVVKDTRPKDVNEVKRFIYNALKEKYGTAVISKLYEKDVVIDTQTEHLGDNNVRISLEYFH